MMKKSLLVISMMLVLAIVVGGCATKGDLEKVQSQEMHDRRESRSGSTGCAGCQGGS